LGLRRHRVEERGELARLAVTAFGFGLEDAEKYFDPDQNPRLDAEQVYVVEEDGEVRASATVLPLEVFVDGKTVPMGGIAAVMTHPAYRRRGYAGDLMRAVLPGMRERDVHLSALWPFAHAFYRLYGWELAGESITYTLKPADLPTSPEQKRLRAYRDEDVPRLMDLFDAEAADHALCVRRSEDHWRKGPRVGEKREISVYERDGNVEGYAIYRISAWNNERGMPSSPSWPPRTRWSSR
jgi:predicted acetyltransferase